MAAGVGVDLGPIQCHRAHRENAHLARQQQHLDEQRLDLLEKPSPECGDGVVVGMVVRGDEAERHRIVGCPFEFAGRKYPGGAAIHEEAQQHRRVGGSRTGAAIAFAHRAQVQTIHHLHDELRQGLCGSHSSTEGGIKKPVRRSVGRKFGMRHPVVAANWLLRFSSKTASR